MKFNADAPILARKFDCIVDFLSANGGPVVISKGSKQTVPIVATYHVPLERIGDLLVNAFEGGSNYWAAVVECNSPANMTRYATSELSSNAQLADAVLNEGGWVKIEDVEDPAKGAFVLDLEACKRGLQMMANASWKGAEGHQRPLHFWEDFLKENDDTETADVFLQLALFGEIIHG